jgi:hypothetical protein
VLVASFVDPDPKETLALFAPGDACKLNRWPTGAQKTFQVPLTFA